MPFIKTNGIKMFDNAPRMGGQGVTRVSVR